MELNIHITDERKMELTMDAICALEDWVNGVDGDMRATRELVATFMTDDQGVYLDTPTALRIIGRVKQRDFVEQVFTPFFAAFKEHLVPKANGKPSSSPSTTEEAAQPGSGT
jgi:hypothetical protein